MTLNVIHTCLSLIALYIVTDFICKRMFALGYIVGVNEIYIKSTKAAEILPFEIVKSDKAEVKED